MCGKYARNYTVRPNSASDRARESRAVPGKTRQIDEISAPAQAHVCGRASVEFVFHIFFCGKAKSVFFKIPHFEFPHMEMWKC